MIICSSEAQNESYMVSKLQVYNRPVTSVYSPKEFSDYLKSHFAQHRYMDYGILASDVDPEKLELNSSVNYRQKPCFMYELEL